MKPVSKYSRRRVFGFNLVEITLAIGVIAFGMTSIITMCLTGMSQGRAAVGESLSAVIAENVFGMLSSVAKFDTDWTTELKLQMQYKTSPTDRRYLQIDPGFPRMYSQTKKVPDGRWTGNDKDVYMEYTGGSSAGTTDNGLWICRIYTGDLDEDNVEFAAFVRVWMTGTRDQGLPIVYRQRGIPGGAEPDPQDVYVPWDMRAEGGGSSTEKTHSYSGFYVEVSWPITQPESKRQKRLFYKEIAR